MTDNELAVCEFMKSVCHRYFPELDGEVGFSVEKTDHDAVEARALFVTPHVVLHYGDDRVLEPRYRMGLVPVVSHELAHFVDPVDPERVMKERLPAPMMALWEELLQAGLAECSMQGPNG